MTALRSTIFSLLNQKIETKVDATFAFKLITQSQIKFIGHKSLER